MTGNKLPIWPLMLILGVYPLAAEQQESLVPLGIRVRVSVSVQDPSLPERGLPADPGQSKRERIVGTLVRMQNDSIVVFDMDQNAQRAVPVGSVSNLEVSRGRHSRAGRGAFIGLIAGVAGGALTTALLCGSDADGCSSSGGDWTAAVAFVLVGGGALGGTGIGALVGSQIHTERWDAVPVSRIRLRVVPFRGGLRLGGSIGF